MNRLLVIGALATKLAALRPAAAQPPARRLTLPEAVKLALDNGPEIQSAEEGVFASETRVQGTRALRYPKLRTEANVQYWDSPLNVSFSSMPAMGMAPSPTTPIRDQLTWQATISLAQPISGLFVLNRLVALERNGVDAARADQARARLDTAQRAAEAYIRLLQARAVASVADKSVAQVDAQLQRAQVQERAGALGQVDVLRLTSARDSARQGQLRARTTVTIATGALALSLDLPTDAALDVVDDLPDPPVPMTWSEREVAAVASKERPELTGARERQAQAQANISVTRAQILPNIMATAVYQHTEGQATFVPKNAWFVGGTLSWDLWDWGKISSGVKEARHRANQASLAARTLQDQIVFEAQRRLLEARTAYETLAVARSALQASEEAYRIQSVRFGAGAATTTDVLDAETDVSRARSGYAQARYDYYLTQAALARAVGRLPAMTTGGQR